MGTKVLAAEFSNEPDAFIARGMLDDNGIMSWVMPSSMATLYAAGSTWAPIKLYVDSSNLESARRLLHEHGDI